MQDTVGCGDSFAAAVVLGYIRGHAIPPVMALANAVRLKSRPKAIVLAFYYLLRNGPSASIMRASNAARPQAHTTVLIGLIPCIVTIGLAKRLADTAFSGK